jgi:hypothetical protein
MEVRNILTQGTHNNDDREEIEYPICTDFKTKNSTSSETWGKIPTPILIDCIFKIFMKGKPMDTVKVHELKTDPEHYNNIEANHKTHTVRRDDRGYMVGDYVVLRKTKYTGKEMRGHDGKGGERMPLVYTGVSLMCKITNIYNGPGVCTGYAALSLKIIDRYPGRVV